mmetsp:Transcript_22512/g.31329  ORF Transcript_22512/g.31329 Transcript_22512/m.31329 type:complete len:241 (-) Transcript_22512:134-856(-)|eukprot:CAMPEP_0196580384 /NCGR_PEP_ID=MMETSP1081-20130531/28599_1 /TAXON_ID=36882 /ORGANISM="Pyramimonas amylifera, Strain CCMP720" /LENGTH=240 /DNA_ID=CAMNT_0041900239 /DNA_START=215 /DNA_END=937 /DNA_ORIENTATION=+
MVSESSCGETEEIEVSEGQSEVTSKIVLTQEELEEQNLQRAKFERWKAEFKLSTDPSQRHAQAVERFMKVLQDDKGSGDRGFHLKVAPLQSPTQNGDESVVPSVRSQRPNIPETIELLHRLRSEGDALLQKECSGKTPPSKSSSSYRSPMSARSFGIKTPKRDRSMSSLKKNQSYDKSCERKLERDLLSGIGHDLPSNLFDSSIPNKIINGTSRNKCRELEKKLTKLVELRKIGAQLLDL